MTEEHRAYLLDLATLRLIEPGPLRIRPAGQSPRERAEDAYAVALDDLEERWLGTRSHAARLEWSRVTRRWQVTAEYRLGLSVNRPGSSVIITGIS